MPVDPHYPSDRIAYMLEDSQAPILITQTALLDTLPEHNAQVICLDDEWDKPTHTVHREQSHNIKPHHLAYVILPPALPANPKACKLNTALLPAFYLP